MLRFVEPSALCLPDAWLIWPRQEWTLVIRNASKAVLQLFGITGPTETLMGAAWLSTQPETVANKVVKEMT